MLREFAFEPRCDSAALRPWLRRRTARRCGWLTAPGHEAIHERLLSCSQVKGCEPRIDTRRGRVLAEDRNPRKLLRPLHATSFRHEALIITVSGTFEGAPLLFYPPYTTLPKVSLCNGKSRWSQVSVYALSTVWVALSQGGSARLVRPVSVGRGPSDLRRQTASIASDDEISGSGK